LFELNEMTVSVLGTIIETRYIAAISPITKENDSHYSFQIYLSGVKDYINCSTRGSWEIIKKRSEMSDLSFIGFYDTVDNFHQICIKFAYKINRILEYDT
jgi:hypothetical protein